MIVSSDPITGASSDVGRIAIHVSCNDIACAGIKPTAIMLVVIAPASATKEELIHVIEQASEGREGSGNRYCRRPYRGIRRGEPLHPDDDRIRLFNNRRDNQRGRRKSRRFHPGDETCRIGRNGDPGCGFQGPAFESIDRAGICRCK